MSRCFPYPPPGYTLSGASKEALIESIKLQKEKEKAKELKKEKRREKKEKKKEKRKEKKDDLNTKLLKSDMVKIPTLGQNCPVTKGELPLKGKDARIEQLEGSSLTEDRGHAVHFDVPSTSSDSTNTSNKRKRHYLPLLESNGHGKIIRIKLSSKQNGSNSPANANEMRLCSKSGSTYPATQNEGSNNKLKYGGESINSALKIDGEQICSTSRPVEGVTKGKNGIQSLSKAVKTDREQVCSTSRPVEGVTKGNSGIPSLPKAVMTSMQREEMNYNKLFGNWAPPLLQDSSCLDADIDWLFQLRNPAEKRLKIQNDGVSCSSSSALRPHAQLLSGVDLYAMPFTVPF